ncbi:MAG: stage II sporulation protein M, partial [Saprospiraceae bacterium]
MRESSFIDQNKQKWKTYETLLSRPEIDPEALHQAFVEITDDLSYARTFYPNRSVRYYLNNLAQRIFYQLSNTRPFNLSDLVQFWTRQLPTLVFTYRRTLMISLL